MKTYLGMMAMRFSQAELEKLDNEYHTFIGKSTSLSEAYIYRQYKDRRAQEYAKHGFVRRVMTLDQCIKNIFEILPPNQIDPPTPENISNAKINPHAFVINVFGCVDNLAWIWVQERHITKKDGSNIPKSRVGLRKKNKEVRKYFSSEFLGYLDGLDGWFDLQENFRHALAHRIPLYVPPYVVTDDNSKAKRVLDDRMADAVNSGARDEYYRLSDEQEKLGVFWPVMTHSFEENASYVRFHFQVLEDFNNIENLGRKMLEELDR